MIESTITTMPKYDIVYSNDIFFTTGSNTILSTIVTSIVTLLVDNMILDCYSMVDYTSIVTLLVDTILLSL